MKLFDAAKFLEAVWTWMGTVPDVIWSGVIGALLTLFGVLLVNRSNTKRLRIQLKSDELENGRDRIAQLRKDVYLDAPEKAAAVMAFLYSLPHSDLTMLPTPNPLELFGQAASRISAISEMDTVNAINHFSKAVTNRFMDCYNELQEIQMLRMEINLKQGRVDELDDEIRRIQRSQQDAGERGEKQPEVVEAGQRFWLDARMKERNGISNELSTKRAEFQRLLHEANIRTVEHMPEINIAHSRAMGAIRRELGLTGDEAEFEAEILETSKQASEKFLAMSKRFEVLMRQDAEA